MSSKKLLNKPVLISTGTGIVAVVFISKTNSTYGTKNNSNTSFVKTLHYLLFYTFNQYTLHFTF